MSVPIWVDFESAEQSAAVMVRGLSGSSQAWGTLLAHAQAILAGRIDGFPHGQHKSYSFDEWRDLIAAARILDLAATEYGVSDSESQKSAAILAICAFGMSGASVSATAVIEGHHLLKSDLSPGELTALALSSPAMSREVLPELPSGSKCKACIENVASYLARGEEEEFNTAADLLQEAIYEEADAWESYLLSLSRLSLDHAGRLATAKVLKEAASRLPHGYLDRLVSDSPMLLPSQYEAIIDHGVLAPDQNLLITLPTGTGKTLLGELALLSSLGREHGIVCYIAPYVALGRQVAEKVALRTPDNVRVHRLVGGYRAPDSIDPENYQEVVISTPERFDAVLRLRPDLLSAIRCVVFDEAHMVGNGQRGVRLEGIITRLRLAARQDRQVPRFVFLSAVVSNADALANWIGISPSNIVSGTWRPSAKRLLRWTEDGKLRLHAGNDPLRGIPSEVLGETLLPWPKKDFYPATHYGSVRSQEPGAMENVAFLASYQHGRHKQPVLCVCSTRPRTIQLANFIAQHFAPIEPLPQPIKVITDRIDQKYKYLRPLKDALQRGVAYHNSSLPHDVREGIERAVEYRTLRVVAATTTLAEGVDLPFRVTILADWLVFDGEKNSPMDSLLFKNIAGRCGRAGQFTEGDTVIFDNPVGDRQWTTPSRRSVFQDNIFFAKSQPALTTAIDRLDRRNSVASVGSQMLAAIAENPNDDDLASSFLKHSFAKHTHNADSAADRMLLAYKEILAPVDDQPLAIAASPVQLTQFGEAANHGGLSPGTARKLRNALREITERGSSRADLVAISVFLLESLADVPEQGNSDLRRAAANPRSRPVVKLDELELVLDMWLAGEPIEIIFAELPTNKRSKRRPDVKMWLQGISEESTWTDWFAKFCDFINNCLEFFLPWLLRASLPLAEIDDQKDRPWREWARFIELGVDSTWGSLLLDEEVIIDRSVAVQVGRRLDALGNESAPTVEHVRCVLTEVLETEHLEQVLNWLRQREVAQ